MKTINSIKLSFSALALTLMLAFNSASAQVPTYEDYKRYNLDDNTILLYLLDYIKGQKN